MGTNLALHSIADEDYIDMELTSSPSKIICCSSPQNREFEFQMSSTSNERETTTSPADELFYKGKLLPLHLPPRRRMVENLLHTSTTTTTADNPTVEHHHFYSVPLLSAPCTNATNTPLDSCNISPSESCRVSCELNPDDSFFEWSNELSSSIKNNPTKNSWSKKLKQKLIKHSILVQKLKASKVYLKSLFSKSADEFSAENLSKVEASKYLYIGKKFASIMKNIDRDGIDENAHRRSFSGAIKGHSTTKCLSLSSSNSSSGSSSSSSSSSFSFSSGGFHELHCLRRSSSATEIEVSVDAAIAYCKKSMQSFQTKELDLCSLSASKIQDEEFDEREESIRKSKSR